jgi:Zn-dependent protease
MQVYSSKSFVAFVIVLWVVFCAGLLLPLPLWIKILLFVPLMEYTFHEYVHSFVAWLHGIKTESIILTHSKMCCKLVPLPDNDPNKDKIYARIILSGGLFQIAIYTFEITILILSFVSLNNIMPLMFAGAMGFRYNFYDVFPKNCDIRRIIAYSIRCGKSQPLSPLNTK